MIKKIIPSLLISLVIIFPVFSQFKPDEAEKSLVKIMVSDGTKLSVCTGFIWKDRSTVVTSLHAMKAGGKIQVVYPGDNIREASILKVFESADLVMLKTNIDKKPLTNEVIPLTKYFPGKVEFGEKIYSIGYNGGSRGDQTQVLEKGHANPETLEFIVRPQDMEQLSLLGFPSVKIPILYLSGSLLPGYSGAPVYNTRNELIGIGDGGLERGLMNVSWAIPAYYLDQLESSTLASLPPNIGKASILYSAEISIDVNPAKSLDTYSDVEKQLSEKYRSFSFGKFNFYQTKTRTFEEMRKTSIDPENMDSFADEFEEMKIFIDYDNLDFDVFEEINNGFALAIPAGTHLDYNKENDELEVDLSEWEGGEYFELYYYLIKHQGHPFDEVIDDIREAYGKDCGGVEIENEYTKSYQINKEWKADYLALQGVNPMKDDSLGMVLPMFFVSIISNDSIAFYSMTICSFPVERQDIFDALEHGIDCVKDYDKNASSCEIFGWLYHMMAAVHLTTVSSLH